MKLEYEKSGTSMQGQTRRTRFQWRWILSSRTCRRVHCTIASLLFVHSSKHLVDHTVPLLSHRTRCSQFLTCGIPADIIIKICKVIRNRNRKNNTRLLFLNDWMNKNKVLLRRGSSPKESGRGESFLHCFDFRCHRPFRIASSCYSSRTIKWIEMRIEERGEICSFYSCSENANSKSDKNRSNKTTREVRNGFP